MNVLVLPKVSDWRVTIIDIVRNYIMSKHTGVVSYNGIANIRIYT